MFGSLPQTSSTYRVFLQSTQKWKYSRWNAALHHRIAVNVHSCVIVYSIGAVNLYSCVVASSNLLRERDFFRRRTSFVFMCLLSFLNLSDSDEYHASWWEKRNRFDSKFEMQPTEAENRNEVWEMERTFAVARSLKYIHRQHYPWCITAHSQPAGIVSTKLFHRASKSGILRSFRIVKSDYGWFSKGQFLCFLLENGCADST